MCSGSCMKPKCRINLKGGCLCMCKKMDEYRTIKYSERGFIDTRHHFRYIDINHKIPTQDQCILWNREDDEFENSIIKELSK